MPASPNTSKRIGIITSGGDCGGLNAVIKGTALAAIARGATAVIIPNGYAGLYNLVDIERLVELTPGRLGGRACPREGRRHPRRRKV